LFGIHIFGINGIYRIIFSGKSHGEYSRTKLD